MRKASERISDADRAAIRAAVTELERHTTCEVVPAVASTSGRYDRAEDLVGLWLAMAAASALWWWFPRPLETSGDWSFTSAWYVLGLLVTMIIAFVGGASLASRMWWLRRWCTPGKQMREEVALRARALFHDARIHRTRAGTGLLVYVSLWERRAVLLADEQVVTAVGQPCLDAWCQCLVETMATSGPSAALIAVLSKAQPILAEKLPRPADDSDELPNEVIILD